VCRNSRGRDDHRLGERPTERKTKKADEEDRKSKCPEDFDGEIGEHEETTQESTPAVYSADQGNYGNAGVAGHVAHRAIGQCRASRTPAKRWAKQRQGASILPRRR
jgi:hypothetical protein